MNRSAFSLSANFVHADQQPTLDRKRPGRVGVLLENLVQPVDRGNHLTTLDHLHDSVHFSNGVEAFAKLELFAAAAGADRILVDCHLGSLSGRVDV